MVPRNLMLNLFLSLGPTMKMRRPIINKMYTEKIDAFYN